MTSKVYTNLYAALIERFINLSGSDKQKKKKDFGQLKKNLILRGFASKHRNDTKIFKRVFMVSKSFYSV